MNPLFAAILGVIEGLTEYLPVSSTGHLILAGHFLGAAGDAEKSFEIVIQLGAILAVVVHYRKLLVERVAGLFARDDRSVALGLALAFGFVPTAVVGLLLRKIIKRVLFGPLPVVAALVVGGVVMIVLERKLAKRKDTELDGLEHVTPRRGFLIGLGQCISLWPGSSRSMCTILAGRLTGLSTGTAAEFSFLLALPTLGAATLYELLKAKDELLAPGHGTELAVGMIVSFLVAWGVIAVFLRYLRTRGLEPFGWYRIALGVFVLMMLR
ncbi:MAG TPA: undecaprenyl-diphosphate phosphatase [Polyangiaceae bacterium]|nr:undecaprenyl-diphosphate phosphatase [Polyangiaceae bacterium]